MNLAAPMSSRPPSPSTVTSSPSCSAAPVVKVARRAVWSTVIASTPHTAGLPIPRATTAAWLARPPRPVTMPDAAIMPLMSCGDVVGHSSTGTPPDWTTSSARVESNTAVPTPVPGDAGTPDATTVISSRPTARGDWSRWTAPRLTRWRAVGTSIRPSRTISTAIRTAAAGLRCPGRDWSTNSRPCCTVNSTSHMSPVSASSACVAAWSSPQSCSEWARRASTASGVVDPLTTSSPWAQRMKSPYSTASPDPGSRVKTTPVPESSSRLPKTIACTVTAVPRSSEMPRKRR